jgi:hypothetical protein
MQINYKKSLKFLTLLISAILISSVSAAIYDYMYLNGTVGVQGMSLAWLSGADGTDSGTTINGVTAALTNLKGPPNGTRVYADPVELNNTGASPITFNLTIDTVSGDTPQLISIYVKLYNMNDSSLKGTLNVWESGAEGSDLTLLQITNNNVWRFQWEITWKATATTSNSVTVNLKLQVPV